MPATKDKSKVRRTLRPTKSCPHCHKSVICELANRTRPSLQARESRIRARCDAGRDGEGAGAGYRYYIWQWEVGFHLQSEIENLQRKNERGKK